MATPTPNLGLIMPDMSDEVDQTIPQLATSMGKIDTATGKLSNLTTVDKSSLVGAISESSNGLAALKADVVQRGVNVCSSPYNADPTGVTNSTAAFNSAFTYLLSIGGGEVEVPTGVYKLNINVPSGIIITGKSSGKINSGYPGGTVFSAFELAQPVVTIGGVGNPQVQGASIRNVILQGNDTAQDGLYIAGGSYLEFENVNSINFTRYNINIENLVGLSSYFIYFRHCTTYNAGVSNFRAVYNSAGGSFTTAIYCTDFVSFTLPAKTAEGRIAYLGTEVFFHGWMEATGDDLIVVDKDISALACLSGTDLLIDGSSSAIVIKLKHAANSYDVTQYIKGNVKIDGKIRMSDATVSGKTGFGCFPYDAQMYNPRIYNYLTFNDQDKKNNDLFIKARIYSSFQVLRFDGNPADSKGFELSGTYDKPFKISNSQGNTGLNLWHNAGVLMANASAPSSATDGQILTMFRSNVPSSKTASGIQGQWSADASYFYVCYAANSWHRIAKDATW